MASLSRRDLLKMIGVGVATSVVGKPSEACARTAVDTRGAHAMLYDTTVCIGCDSCVAACAKANGLEPDSRRSLTPELENSTGLWHMPTDLNAQTKNIIKLYRDDDSGNWSFIKKQCMHCLDPACVSGCPFSALQKGENGVVEWNGNQCIGCRFCEVACPFGVPAFEWDEFNPKIVKCQFCDHLVGKTQEEPACTTVCPTGAVIFGSREELLEEANRRTKENPGKYFEDRPYGVTEGGGLQVLYLSHVPFEKIGLPKLTKGSIPKYATKYQSIIYKWLMVPAVAYAVMTSFIKKNWKEHTKHVRDVEAQGGPPDQL